MRAYRGEDELLHSFLNLVLEVSGELYGPDAFLHSRERTCRRN